MFAKLVQRVSRRTRTPGGVHGAVAVNAGAPGRRTAVVSSVSEEELDRHQAEELPERTQMSVLRPPIAIGPELPEIEPMPPDVSSE